MPITVGKIVEGKVTGITNFGAFVQLDEETNGLVHISEVSNDYVENIRDYIKTGDKVKVKILSVSDDGKIGLSMKQAKAKDTSPKEVQWVSTQAEQKGMSFEDKLSQFLKDSNERHDQLNYRNNRRSSARARKGGSD